MATKKVLTETGLSRLVGLINSKFAEKTEVPKKTSDITNDSGFITAASPGLTGVPTAPTAASGTDTTQIATTAFVQGAVAGKADVSSVYTKTEIDNAISNKVDSSSVYTKTEVNNALSDKADASNVYTKAEVDSALGNASPSAIQEAEIQGYWTNLAPDTSIINADEVQY